MYILYEEGGAFKAGTILSDNETSLQVESAHGKRGKVKANSVMLRYAAPAPLQMLEEAQRVADDIDADFLWEASGTEEFGFADLAREYFGGDPGAVQTAAILLKLHQSPMHFYKKGKGRYRPAPPEALEAAKASVERKRVQAEKQAAYVNQLCESRLPEEFKGQVLTLLHRPDKNSLEFKALEEACHATGLTAVRLLDRCGAIPSSHDYHFGVFLMEHFPRGTGFDHYPTPAVEDTADLPQSEVVAFSIDDATTTEIDDAFSVRQLPNGNWQVGIHIAAPAMGFGPESTANEIALSRLSTVYMPGNKITMLPDSVVERFTLAQARLCPAVSMYIELAASDLSIVGSRSVLEQVWIEANLRHDTLEPVFNDASLNGGGASDYPFRKELETLWHFASRLETARGADDGKLPKVDYSFVIENDQVRIIPRRRGSPIDKVVSELMIHVNSNWAKLLADSGYPAIFRSQISGKVRMSTTPAPHQGLGVEQYVWASSPLRRYIDLVNQRQLIALLRGESAPYPANSPELFSAMRAFDLAHDAYNSFQRTMERYWCLRYLLQEKIEVAEATVWKENLVRLERMPLVVRVLSLPELPAGTPIRVAISDVDLLELDVVCQFREALTEPWPTPGVAMV